MATQGRKNYAQWVTKYKMSYSTDGETFTSNNKVRKCKRHMQKDVLLRTLCNSGNYWWMGRLKCLATGLDAFLSSFSTSRRCSRYLRGVGKDDWNFARHFNLTNHSKQHMAVCGLSLLQGSTESRKTLEQKIIFQIGTLNPHGINEHFSLNYFIFLLFTLPCTNQ